MPVGRESVARQPFMPGRPQRRQDGPDPVGVGPVELFGRVGQARSELQFKGLGSAEDTDISYGGGLRLIPGKNLTFSADYMNYYNKGGARIEGYTLSIGYRF